MAVGVGSRRRIYVCASTDTKPGNVSVGTRLYETDTGRHLIFNGTEWVSFVGA